ncbi:MAG: DUF6931 family protein [Longimicrobiales bacterium]
MQMLRSGRTVPSLCDAAELSEEALDAFGDDVAPRTFLERLVAQEQFDDAIAFLAHALPRREAVWWAWLCARAAAGDKPAASVMASLDATKTWIAEPTDAHRRAALDAAEITGIGSPAGCAGLAAFLCGDTLGPAGAPAAPPGEFAAAKAIGGCINMAAVADAKADIGARYREFVQKGLELADRTQLWTPDAPAAPARG